VVWLEEGLQAGQQIRALSGFGVDGSGEECFGSLDYCVIAIGLTHVGNHASSALVGERPDE
jgi:hypothetical protein